VNGSEKLTGEASNSVNKLDLNINARALGYIGLDAIIFCLFPRSDTSKFRLIMVIGTWPSNFLYDFL